MDFEGDDIRDMEDGDILDLRGSIRRGLENYD